MKAVVRENHQLHLRERPDPVPGEGQVITRTLSCGICGSDLHALHSLEEMTVAGKPGAQVPPEIPNIIFGHEFCGEILDHGPNTEKRLKAGTKVVAIGFVNTPMGLQSAGFSPIVPGGFAEQMILTERLLLPVTNGLSDAQAAMTEPFAVGEHAVARSAAGPDTINLVVGCGPVGLAVIAALKARGWGPIIASDYSPARRAIAEKMGADIVVNPAEESPHSHWGPLGASGLTPRTIDTLFSSPGKRAIAFECVGVPGVIQSMIASVPLGTQIVVAGVCAQTDTFEPLNCIGKEIELKFVFAYDETEFANTLHNIAEGHIDVLPVITGEVGLDGVAKAFDDLSNPEMHCKIVVNPTLN
ncbi:zinc-binding dehydrogenase [Novosphingobium pentaromativorans]|uniref:Threonine dehydrogenase n=1 Tax=Novosphingobium pentaromativorans US6-1 TaxID=1088721 RepID=G6E7Y7_9SPHN|nr:zinc-binding dehydrogenase [Novosphingobium pentaromativorans]AIT81496.1 alcohol dehydrogenase [Novosphingobium pentaromativorans US6-1]EHJ62630.1 threonine dehydrogenase [Novosphingobium pentaromativorans US6-1]